LELYALTVAHGFRPPIADYVPAEVAAIIQECWKGDPELRPNMNGVIYELKRIRDSGEQMGRGGWRAAGGIQATWAPG
jgi:hypothetical protein